MIKVNFAIAFHYVGLLLIFQKNIKSWKMKWIYVFFFCFFSLCYLCKENEWDEMRYMFHFYTSKRRWICFMPLFIRLFVKVLLNFSFFKSNKIREDFFYFLFYFMIYKCLSAYVFNAADFFRQFSKGIVIVFFALCVPIV